MPKPNWFQFTLQAESSVADVFINDYIGDWFDQMWKDYADTKSPVTAKGIIDELAALPDSVKTIRVRINSPGGDVMAAVMIANAFRDQRVTKGRTVETIVEGLAASSASVIAMAGSPVRMADNAILMIHNPSTYGFGSAADMRKTAEVLDQVRAANIIPTYQWHSKLSDAEIGALMDAETWMDADEAIENGFADEKVEGLKAAASIEPSHATALKVPARFADRVQALLKPADPVEPIAPEASATPATSAKSVSSDDVLKACSEAGLDLPFARTVMAEQLTAAALTSRIASEKATRAAAETRATHIRALCGDAHSDLAADLIASGLSFDQVKSHMAKVAAKLDKVEIDSNLLPDDGKRRGKAVLNISDIYAELNKPR